MTMMVVDASVAAKWYFPESHVAEARGLLSARLELWSPDLIWCEVANIVWKRVRRGDIQPDEATDILAEFLKTPIKGVAAKSLVASALEIAVATDRTVYDGTYLALAVDLNCQLITADDRLVNALKKSPFAQYVLHISDVK